MLDLLQHLKKLPTEDELRDLVSKALPEKTYVYYVDRDDHLNHKQYEKAADEALQGGEPYSFSNHVLEAVWEWDTTYSMGNYISDMRSGILKHLEGYDEEQLQGISELLDEQDDYARELIIERDASEVFKDLCRNSRDYEIRVHLNSNFEGLDSGWSLSNSEIRYEGYLMQMIDVLNLNPAKFKEALQLREFKVVGRWPNLKARDGNEYVYYQHLVSEMCENSSFSALCLIGLVSPRELEDFTGKIKFYKGASLGLFSPWQGGGGMLEVKLLRDMEIDVNKSVGGTPYDHFSAHIDSQHGYSVDSTYGPTRSFWGGNVTLS